MGMIIPIVSIHTLIKLSLWNKKHQLCENSLTAIHYAQDYAHKFCQFKSYTTEIICICLIDKMLQNI